MRINSAVSAEIHANNSDVITWLHLLEAATRMRGVILCWIRTGPRMVDTSLQRCCAAEREREREWLDTLGMIRCSLQSIALTKLILQVYPDTYVKSVIWSGYIRKMTDFTCVSGSYKINGKCSWKFWDCMVRPLDLANHIVRAGFRSSEAPSNCDSGAPTALYPFLLLNVPIIYYIFFIFYLFIYKFRGPLKTGDPRHCFFCFYVNSPLHIVSTTFPRYYYFYVAGKIVKSTKHTYLVMAILWRGLFVLEVGMCDFSYSLEQ